MEDESPIKQGICYNCGARLLHARSQACLHCGAQHIPVQIGLANRIMQERGLNSVVITKSFKFKDKSDSGKFDEGLILLENMKLHKALEYYDNHIKRYPQKTELWNNFGVVFMGLYNCKDALFCYKKAVEINPNYYIGLYNIGAVHMVCRQYEIAFKFYDKTLRINPKCAEAYWDKKIVKENQGDFDLNAKERGIEMGMDILRAQRNDSSALIDLGNGKDAILGSSMFFLRDIGTVRKHYNEAIEKMEDGNLEEALKLFDSCININHDDYKSWIYKGIILKDLKRYNEALVCFNNSIKVNPNQENSWTWKGYILAQQKKINEATKCIEQALRINPFDSLALSFKSAFDVFDSLIIRCKNCGTVPRSKEKFCGKCGTKIIFPEF